MMEYFVLNERRFVLAPVAPPVVAPNAEGWYRYQVLHDWQTPLWSFTARPPSPEVNRIGTFHDRNSHDKVCLNFPMQFHWAELLSMHKFGRMLVELNSAERDYINDRMDIVMGKAFALTNRGGGGDEPYPARNYVADTYQGWEEAKLAALICGGNTVWGKPAGVNIRGEAMVEIYSHLWCDPLPPPSLTDPRTLWLTAIQNNQNVYPFTHLGDGVGVPYPLITAERYYYPAAGLQAYSHDERIRPRYVRNGVATWS